MHESGLGKIWDWFTTSWDFLTKSTNVDANVRNRIGAQAEDTIRKAGGGQAEIDQLYRDLAGLAKKSNDGSTPFNWLLVIGLVIALLVLLAWKD